MEAIAIRLEAITIRSKDATRWPFVPSSFFFLVVRPGAPNSFLFLVAMPVATSSVLTPSSDARSP